MIPPCIEPTKTEPNSSTSEVIPAGRKCRFALFGDHSSYHCGSAAVIKVLRRKIEALGGVVSVKDEYDALLVNGEGSMHHDSVSYQRKMRMLEKAMNAGKPAYLINSLWQDNSNTFDHVLRNLSGIVVREQLSHDQLLERHGVESMIRLDLSREMEIDEEAPFLDLKGEMAVGDFFYPALDCFVKMVGGAFSKAEHLDMKALSWSSLVKTLRTASVFVTGRHHGVFAACRARTPFVAFAGNSHKLQGVFRMSGLDFPHCENQVELKCMVEWAQQNRNLYDQFFDWMEAQPTLSLS